MTNIVKLPRKPRPLRPVSQKVASNNVEKRDMPVAWRCRWKSEPDWKYGEKPCSAKDHAREEPGFEEQALCLETSLAELRWALEIQEKAEEAHANCTECDGEEVPELCPVCFPLFDDARIARRSVLAAVGGSREP
jgi:hypothetical protein